MALEPQAKPRKAFSNYQNAAGDLGTSSIKGVYIIEGYYPDDHHSPYFQAQSHTYLTTARSQTDVESILEKKDEKKLMHDNGEREKTTIHKNGLLPRLQRLLHLVPIGIIMVFLALNFHRVYWEDVGGSRQSFTLTAFQFGAKFLEILIVMSISELLLNRIRSDLIHQRGVPIGYLASPYQLTQTGYLFSSEFWSPIKLSSLRRLKLGFLILAAMVLVAIVGPSAAVLMIPTNGWWDVHTSFSNGSESFFMHDVGANTWPDVVTNTSLPSFEIAGEVDCMTSDATLWGWCPAKNWNAVYQWANNYQNQQLMPNLTLVSDGNTVRYLTSSGDRSLGNSVGWSVSSTVSDKQARDLIAVWTYAHSKSLLGSIGRPKIIPSLPAGLTFKKPLVQVECAVDYSNSSALELPHSYFRNSPLAHYHNQKWTISRVNFTKPARLTAFKWVNTSDYAGSPSIGALFQVLTINQTTTPVTIACTVDARWVPVKLWLDPTVDTVIQQDSPNPIDLVSNSSDQTNEEAIPIHLDWANALNPIVETHDGFNLTAIEKMIQAFGYPIDAQDPNVHVLAPPDQNLTLIPWCVSTALGMYITDGLAQIHAHDQQTYVYHHGASANSSSVRVLDNFDYTAFSNYPRGTEFAHWAAQQSGWTRVTYTIMRHGYSWGFDSAPKLIAAVILACYILLAMWRSGREMCDARVARSWGSLGEMLVLGINSRPTAVLQNTSAGVESSRTWRQDVRVVEADGDGLEGTRLALAFCATSADRTVADDKKYA